MKLFAAIFIMAGVLLLSSGNRLARGEELAPSGVVIKADSLTYDKDKDTYQATGDVEIVWDGYTLYSDIASLQQGSGKADAKGKVRLVKGEDILTCDRLDVNVNTDQGEATNGDIFVRNKNFRVRGARMAKVGKEDYRLEKGTFTTCDGDSPSWKFTASNLDITLNDYATGQNAVFYVKDLPIFYFPYLIFPVKRERESGFLFPRLGNSTKKGFTLDIPYYWVISPSQEATFSLDIQTKRSAGIGVDYRYLRPNDSKGDIRAFFIYDTQKSMPRGNLVVSQEENFSPSLSLKSNVNLALDREFYRDYGEINGDYNRQLLDSTVALSWRRQSSLLSAELRYVDDLTAANNEATLQKFPVVTFTTVGEKVGSTPVYFALDSDFTNFYRGNGQQGQRVELHPSATLYASFPSGPDISVRGGYLLRFYNAYGGDNPNGYHGDGLADAAATVSTTLARVYDTGWGNLRRIRHALVPEAGFSFIQEKSQDTLPFFDYHDRILGGQIVSWALTNYFTGKFVDGDTTPVYRDLAWLRLSQGYQLSGSRRNLLTLVDEGNHFTDIRVEARATPISRVTINLDSYFNTYRTRFTSNNVSLDLSDGGGNLFALGYRFSRDQVDYLEGKLGIALVKPFILNYTGRYSIDKGGFLENVVDLEYRQQCWSVIFSYRERPDTREFNVNFTLSGIGSIGKVRAL